MKRIEVFGCLMDAATISYLKSFLRGTLFRVAIYSADEIFLLSPWWKGTYRQPGITKNLKAAKKWVLDNYTVSKVGENLQNAFSKLAS